MFGPYRTFRKRPKPDWFFFFFHLVKRDLSFNLCVIRDCPSQHNFFMLNVKAFLDFNVTREGRLDF